MRTTWAIRLVCSGDAQLRYLHNPGIDLLGAQTDEYLIRNSVQAVHQYERSMTISEAYYALVGSWIFLLEMAGDCVRA